MIEKLHDKNGKKNKNTYYNFSSVRTLYIRILRVCLLGGLCAFPCDATAELVQDSLLSILCDVVNSKYEKFRHDSVPANFVGVRVNDRNYTKLNSVLGVTKNKENIRERLYYINIKIGSLQSSVYQKKLIPPFEGVKFTNVDNKLQASISDDLEKSFSWLKKGSKGFRKDTTGNIIPLNEVSYYSGALPGKYYEESLANDGFDADKWQALLNEVTNKFRSEKNVVDASASMECNMVRRYLVTSDGGEIIDNDRRYTICLSLKMLKSDGKKKALSKWYNVKLLSELPTKKTMMNDANKLLRLLNGLRDAPDFESYEGPVLLGGNATGVFMHEMVGHRLESGYRGGLFKTFGSKIFPDFIQIIDDPTTSCYNDIQLTGHYKYDDEGCPAQAVTCIKDGVLLSMLTSRTPYYAGSVSNGHGRGEVDKETIARQANFFVSTSRPVTDSKIRKMFVNELKRQNLEYGIYIPEIENGQEGWKDGMKPTLFKSLTDSIGDFFVNFNYAYKVYADGRPDELVNGAQVYSFRDAMYNAITAMGAECEVHNALCGAKSGFVPVSLIAPKSLFKCVKLSLPTNDKAHATKVFH